MKDLTDQALNIAALEGARYADIRIVDRREQMASVKNGNVDGIGDQDSQGFGVRVLVENSGGFACSAYPTGAQLDRLPSLRLKGAGASVLLPGDRVDLGEPM